MNWLENWSVVVRNPEAVTPYTAPELIAHALHGVVTGHRYMQDGSIITTSRIVGQRNGKVITASGTEYELGVVDPAYEQAYPDASTRLFKTLKVVA